MVKDGLPEIFKEPRKLSMVLNRISRFLWSRLLRQGPQSFFDVLEPSYHFIPTVQFFHVTRTRIELFFQRNYT